MIRQLRGRRKLSALTYILASFFGAFLIAASFAYYNYKFSKFKFIDFKEIVFYTKADLFEPREKEYILLFYDSRTNEVNQLVEQLNKKEYKILAIDFNRQRFENNPDVVFATTGINNLISLVWKFNIQEIPSAVGIEKIRGSQYKQISHVELF